jgi:hypothetical protein
VTSSTGDLTAPRADPTQGDPHRVFISYSRSDFYFAEQLAAALRQRGLDVWFDVHELRPGTDWSAAIDEAIARCDTFLLVASRSALESPYVQLERERAVESGRSLVSVLPRRPARPVVPELPTYDLAGSFERGVGQIASDLIGGHPRGWRPGIPLPLPATVLLVALSAALATLLGVMMGFSFASAVAGKMVSLLPNGPWSVGAAVIVITAFTAYSAYNLWVFVMRRSSWLSIRGFQISLPLIALMTLWFVDTMAGYINEPWVFALGGISEEAYLGDLSWILGVGVVLTGILAAIVTSFGAGPFRHLKTGIAPDRVRRRHVGFLASPAEPRSPARSYQLIFSEADASVADEARSAFAGIGMSEAGADRGSDCQIVIVSDRTPMDWLARDELRVPIAVVATSIALPVRGVLQRFQWVDYRRRRKRTLSSFAGDLGTESPDGDAGLPQLPESLQEARFPLWVRVVEWTLLSMATVAILLAAYPVVQIFTEEKAEVWPALLGLPIAGGIFVLARLVRGRWITPGVLVASMALAWLGMYLAGLDQVARAIWAPSEEGPPVSATLGYALVSAIVIALAWRTLRRWLPRRRRWTKSPGPVLGTAGGSWPWHVVIVPLAFGLLSAAGLSTPPSTSAPPIETLMDPTDVCNDRANMLTLLSPLDAVNTTALTADSADTVRSAVEQRIELMTGVIGDLGPFQPTGTWGTEMKARLVASLEGVVRADQTFLDRGSVEPDDYQALDRTVEELNAPFC